jgi:hypothetical protein
MKTSEDSRKAVQVIKKMYQYHNGRIIRYLKYPLKPREDRSRSPIIANQYTAQTQIAQIALMPLVLVERLPLLRNGERDS